MAPGTTQVLDAEDSLVLALVEALADRADVDRTAAGEVVRLVWTVPGG